MIQASCTATDDKENSTSKKVINHNDFSSSKRIFFGFFFMKFLFTFIHKLTHKETHTFTLLFLCFNFIKIVWSFFFCSSNWIVLKSECGENQNHSNYALVLISTTKNTSKNQKWGRKHKQFQRKMFCSQLDKYRMYC